MISAHDLQPSPLSPRVPQSCVEGLYWPALPGQQGRQLLAGLQQLGQSEWWPRDVIEAQQLAQLGLVVEHALDSVPFYQEDWGVQRADLPRVWTMEAWRSLPIVTRRMVQQAGRRMVTQNPPREHGPINSVVTSGSTGRPIEGFGSQVTYFIWSLMTMRDHEWHRRDFSGRLAGIRMFHGPGTSQNVGVDGPDWGRPVNLVYPTGPAASLSIHAPVSFQVEWLKQKDPHYLLTYPSNLVAIARYCAQHGVRLTSLRQARTLGELVTPEARRLCRELLGVPITDMYSAQEVGYMALQCPDHDHYHVQSESVLLEVLDENDEPCKPGEVGRVVVSSLHNFIMPLLRYEIGDWAMVGEACPCGRGLPVLTRIMGRQRNMIVLPDGDQRFVVMDDDAARQPHFAPVLRIEQCQVIQRTLEEVELVLVVRQRFSPEEEAIVTEFMTRSFGHPFRFIYTYVDEIPRTAAGKFEDFRCEVSAEAIARAKERAR